MGLNKENTNFGYLLGQFASVVNRAVLTTGQTLTPHLLKDISTYPAHGFAEVHNYYTQNTVKEEFEKYSEMIREIVSKMNPEDLIEHLNSKEQCSFWLGYYHQNAELEKQEA